MGAGVGVNVCVGVVVLVGARVYVFEENGNHPLN
jgi:hypothetical protein